jgi:hypothetical protein
MRDSMAKHCDRSVGCDDQMCWGWGWRNWTVTGWPWKPHSCGGRVTMCAWSPDCPGCLHLCDDLASWSPRREMWAPILQTVQLSFTVGKWLAQVLPAAGSKEQLGFYPRSPESTTPVLKARCLRAWQSYSAMVELLERSLNFPQQRGPSAMWDVSLKSDNCMFQAGCSEPAGLGLWGGESSGLGWLALWQQDSCWPVWASSHALIR